MFKWLRNLRRNKLHTKETRESLEHWCGVYHVKIEDTSAFDKAFPKWRKRGLTQWEFRNKFHESAPKTLIPSNPIEGRFEWGDNGGLTLTKLGREEAGKMVDVEEQHIMQGFRKAMSDLILMTSKMEINLMDGSDDQKEFLKSHLRDTQRAAVKVQYYIDELRDF